MQGWAQFVEGLHQLDSEQASHPVKVKDRGSQHKKNKVDYNKVGARGLLKLVAAACSCCKSCWKLHANSGDLVQHRAAAGIRQGLCRCHSELRRSMERTGTRVDSHLQKKTKNQTNPSNPRSGLGRSCFNSCNTGCHRQEVRLHNRWTWKCLLFPIPRTKRATYLSTHAATSESDLCAICGSYLQRKCCRLVTDVSPDNVTLD